MLQVPPVAEDIPPRQVQGLGPNAMLHFASAVLALGCPASELKQVLACLHTS